MVGFVPLIEFEGINFDSREQTEFVEAETMGFYIINDIAPNVCRMTRVQTVGEGHKIKRRIPKNE